MAEDQELDIAIADLDELIDALEGDIKRGGFNNKSIMWLMEGWTKIGILTSGSGDGFHKKAAAYWIMKRTPPPAREKRSKSLLRALEQYSEVLSNSHVKGGDYFRRADDEMRNFVWEYRQHLSGQKEKQFVHDLHKWMSKSKDEVMQQAVFNMDR